VSDDELADVHFGSASEEAEDWRKLSSKDDDDEDDDEITSCDPTIIKMLGFDPFDDSDDESRSDADFKESEHPRESDGKFAPKGGGGGGGASSGSPYPKLEGFALKKKKSEWHKAYKQSNQKMKEVETHPYDYPKNYLLELKAKHKKLLEEFKFYNKFEIPKAGAANKVETALKNLSVKPIPSYYDKLAAAHDPYPGVKPVQATMKPPVSAGAPAKPKIELPKRSKEASREMLRAIAKHRPAPTPEEHSAIQSYKGAGYTEMNIALRHKRVDTPKTTELKNWLNKASLPQDVDLFRGVKSEYAMHLWSLLDEGAIFVDRGFVSTTVDPSFADSWASGASWPGGVKTRMIMVIKAKQGQKAAAIRSANVPDSESEVLIQAGSRFKVTKMDFEHDRVEVELIQGQSA